MKILFTVILIVLALLNIGVPWWVIVGIPVVVLVIICFSGKDVEYNEPYTYQDDYDHYDDAPDPGCDDEPCYDSGDCTCGHNCDNHR